jgi:hypothetical protein
MLLKFISGIYLPEWLLIHVPKHVVQEKKMEILNLFEMPLPLSVKFFSCIVMTAMTVAYSVLKIMA